jgi:predicted RNA-binding protein YlxR (DUF448 family)
MTARVPIRMCVSCRRHAPQAELVRFGRGAQGPTVQLSQRRGRGAYVCARRECLAQAVSRGALYRGLRLRAETNPSEQIAGSSATVVESRLERIARCPSAGPERERLVKLLRALQSLAQATQTRTPIGNGAHPGVRPGQRPKGGLAKAHG